MIKRQRGRGRKPGGGGGGGGGHQPNRTLESTGPDVKIRGSAAHIYDKYMQLSRDAASAGDRVASESYLQHAEHYYRMLRAMQPQQMPQLDQRFTQELDYEDEGGEGEEFEGAEGEGVEGEGGGDQPYMQREQRPQQQRAYREQGRDQQSRDQQPRNEQQGGGYNNNAPRPEGQSGDEQNAQGGAEGEFRQGRNRSRNRNRGRYRPDGERGPDNRGPRPEGGNENTPAEGFGEVVPAFLGGDS